MSNHSFKQLIAPVPSVNYHLWEPCNMRCQFCFATFQDVKQTVLPKGHLPKTESLAVVRALAQAGFEKITFAGGEPTLCPWLTDLIREAKQQGMTTMLVTNGSKLTPDLLRAWQGQLNWITLSIDSLIPETNQKTGRALLGKRPLAESTYRALIQQIQAHGFRLKINTVVSSANWQEDMGAFIRWGSPERWKVFQVLPVEGQNDGKVAACLISRAQFQNFLDRHQGIGCLVPEDNEALTASYVMVDPAGRFFDNAEGAHTYSPPVLEVGVEAALQEVSLNIQRFLARGGKYDW